MVEMARMSESIRTLDDAPAFEVAFAEMRKIVVEFYKLYRTYVTIAIVAVAILLLWD
jgi:hypothetical protein